MCLSSFPLHNYTLNFTLQWSYVCSCIFVHVIYFKMFPFLLQFDRKTRMKEISRRLSHTLDCLGYGQHMIRLRQEFYWKYDEKERLEIKNHVKYRYFRRRIVGSRSEGSVKSEESDIDCLVFNYLHTCIDETVPLSSVRISPGGYIYRMVPCVFHPGQKATPY